MASKILYIKIFLWHSLFRKLPSYELRNYLFKYLLKNKIGNKSSLHRGLEIYCVGGISIGDNSTINKYVDLDGRGSLRIGNNVSVSAYTKIITASHAVNAKNFDYIKKPVVVEDYVWIGTGAIILPGVTLKKGCVVGSGSVVTKNVEEFTIVAGNPVRVIGERTRDLDYSPIWRPLLQ